MGYDVKWLTTNQFIITGFKSESSNQVYLLIDNTNNLPHTSVDQIDNKSPKIFRIQVEEYSILKVTKLSQYI